MKNSIIRAKKGQVFTWDLAISIAIFLIVLSMIFYMWDTTTSKATEIKDIKEMEIISTEVTELLIRTPGVPRDWEATDNGTYKYNVTNITSIGLANIEPRILSREKMCRFVNLSYDDIRPLLGTRQYNFYFNVTYLNGTQVFVNTQNCSDANCSGINCREIAQGVKTSNAAFELTSRRTAILDNEIVRIYFTVWTNFTYAPGSYTRI